MAYDEGLALRVRGAMGEVPGVVEKRMFGGLAMLVHGNMAVGVGGDALIVRCAIDDFAQLLEEPGAQVFDMTGRVMRGWLLVDAEAIAEDEDLQRWVRRGVDFATSLPPK